MKQNVNTVITHLEKDRPQDHKRDLRLDKNLINLLVYASQEI